MAATRIADPKKRALHRVPRALRFVSLDENPGPEGWGVF